MAVPQVAEVPLALKRRQSYGAIHTIASYAYTYQGRHEEAVAAAHKAIESSGTDVTSHHMCAITFNFAGEFLVGKTHELHYDLVNPTGRNVSRVELARAQYHLGELEAARTTCLAVLESGPAWLTAQTLLLAALQRLRRSAEVAALKADILERRPGFSVTRWAGAFPYRYAEHLEQLVQPLLDAGLPERAGHRGERQLRRMPFRTYTSR